MKYDVCVFGGCSLDQTFYQKSDGTYNDKPDLKAPGGKGANQAVAACKAGAKTTIITRIGRDDVGDNILENLRFNMVDTSNVEYVKDIQSDRSNIYIRLKDKDNEIHRTNGAINSFTVDMIDEYSDVLLNSSIILCQLKIPKEVTEKLIDFCYDNKKILILTPCRPEKLAIKDDSNNVELINKISLITCNKKECETIFGTDDIEGAVKQYPNKLIVTLGKDGLMYHNGKKVIQMPAVETEVIDTVAAGDTLCGNVACALSKGIDLEHALRRAMYATAMKLKVKSAQAGMPLQEDLDNFIETTRNKRFDYKKELNFAISLTKEAYNIAKSAQRLNILTKDNDNLVTDADIKVEGFLISQIKSKFPDDNFITEETNPDGVLKNRTWIIDPIDGTNQFIKGSKDWGIQLAFYDKEYTRFSIIYLPQHDEFYYAAENQGAYINNNKIIKIEPQPLNRSIVEFGGTLFKDIDKKKILFDKLVKKDTTLVANLLHLNVCSISFTNLASGKTDALVISSHSPWDIMPGAFLLKEIGVGCDFLDFDKKLRLYTDNEAIKDLLL